MIVTVDLFTRPYAAQLSVQDDGVNMTLIPKAQTELEDYLRLVLPYYVTLPEDGATLSLLELIEIANQWQEANPEAKLAEPTTKLPYDMPTETKGMLEQLASHFGTSQTQILVQLIDKKYERIVKGKGD